MQIACGVIYIEGKILLLKKAYGKYEGLYEFPGGKRDDEDLNLKYALKRELREELGCDGSIHELIHFMKINKEDCGTNEDLLLYFYHAKLEDFNIRLSKEHKEYIWVTFEEAKELPLIKWDYALLDYFQQYFRNLTL